MPLSLAQVSEPSLGLVFIQLDSSLTHEEGLCQLEPACRALSPDDLENHLSAVDANIHHLAVFSGVALFSPAALFSAKWRRRRREVGDGAGRGHHGVGVLVFFLVSVGPGKKKSDDCQLVCSVLVTNSILFCLLFTIKDRCK